MFTCLYYKNVKEPVKDKKEGKNEKGLCEKNIKMKKMKKKM